MENCRIETLRAEFVNLLRKQVEALELEAYVGLNGHRTARIRQNPTSYPVAYGP